MNKPTVNLATQKNELHPRNKHRLRYDFEQLINVCPDLRQYVALNKFNSLTIDFTNPIAVKLLNQALLKQFYHIHYWDIPKNYLCPPIPGRVDYIHTIADLLSLSNAGNIPKGKSVQVFDVGVGANCIYPLLGNAEYGWRFIGSDIDLPAVKVATQIIKSNLKTEFIECRHQTQLQAIFKGVLKPEEIIDVTMCNPPFHSSATEAQSGTDRKWQNLGYKKSTHQALNFGGQTNELWCKGGELAFITRMIEESILFKNSSLWFTSLVSKSSNLPVLYNALKKANAVSVKTVNMSQGSKISRMLAWTFLNENEHIQWSLKRWNNK